MKEKAIKIVRILRDKGHSAYFVGGCVRDLLMKRESGDIDIATSCLPDEIQKIFPSTIPVGAAFGVIIVMDGKDQFEVATYRSESDYSDGRRPDQVIFSDEKEDVKRRDFTVNALLYDPLEDRIVDYVDGRKDIEAKLIRAVGDPDERFTEDRLRLLRAVRFSSELGFDIEEQTYQALLKHASAVTEVSPERICEELEKMLTGSHPADALRLLQKTRLLKEILPEIEKMRGVEQPENFHPEGDVWEHTLLCFEKAHPPLSKTLAFGILFHDVGKPPTFQIADRIRFNNHDRQGAEITEKICKRLRMSRSDTQLITDLVLFHLRFMNVKQMRVAKLKRFLAMENFNEHLEFHRIDCEASHGLVENVVFCEEKLKEFQEEFNSPKLPKSLLNGYDLMKIGIPKGEKIGIIKEAVIDAQLEGKIKTKKEALQYAKQIYNMGSSPA